MLSFHFRYDSQLFGFRGQELSQVSRVLKNFINSLYQVLAFISNHLSK